MYKGGFVLFALIVVAQSAVFTSTPFSVEDADCGVPTEREITFTDAVILYNGIPILDDPIVPGTWVTVNISGEAAVEVDHGTVTATLLWRQPSAPGSNVSDATVLKVDTLNLCDLADQLACPIAAGPFSYQDSFQVPLDTPRGCYLLTLSAYAGTRNLACTSIPFCVQDPPGAPVCQTQSSYSAIFSGLAYYEVSPYTARQVGHWIQVGPLGSRVSARVASTFPFGSVLSLTGSDDVLGFFQSDVSGFLWGLDGHLVSESTSANGAVHHRYEGTFFLGFDAFDTPADALASGNFDLTFVYNDPTVPSGRVLMSGTINADPNPDVIVGRQPAGWRFPVTIGRLTNTISTLSDGRTQITGTRTYCSCTVDTCGVCGGDGSSCTPTSSSTSTTGPALVVDDKPALSNGGKWAIIGVILGLIVIGGVLLILFIANRRRATSSSGDIPLTEFDRNKPDYGTLAITDIIEENQN